VLCLISLIEGVSGSSPCVGFTKLILSADSALTVFFGDYFHFIGKDFLDFSVGIVHHHMCDTQCKTKGLQHGCMLYM